MPTWKSVRELNDTECSAIENRYIYIYMDIYVCHCWRSVKSIFHQGEDFYQGQGFFEFTSANFFDRERERNHFVLFRSFKLEKRKKLRFSRPHSVKSY